MAKIIVCSVKVPFTSGGQEVLVKTLCAQLKQAGHLVDTLDLPFLGLPKRNLLSDIATWRGIHLEDFLSEQPDLVICTKYPSYFIKHPRKSVWLVHQHRSLYELYGTRYSDFSDDPRDEDLRRLTFQAECQALGEAAKIACISQNVSERLKQYNGIDSSVLNPPLPLGGRYQQGEFGDYILSVSRLCSIKRVDLIIKAMPIIHSFVKLKIVGVADEPGIMEYFKNEIDKHHLWDRVEFLGRVSDEDLINLYAGAGAVYYAPHNEDYGYVTIEGMASGKPILTAEDSGGVLQFVQHEETGLIVAPNTDAIGHGMNRLFEQREFAQQLGQRGRAVVDRLGLMEQGWNHVISELLAPIQG
jgi:glycosyltransferase involved in cell wall biosynthesis